MESQQQILNLSLELLEEEEKIDVLINNAGIYQNKLEYSEDQIEKTIAVNYHSQFILTLHLLPLLDKITFNCLHPGVINTKLLQKGWGAE
ncbi:retinol dehydrogenase-14 [Halanaerobium kushneri]|uniref:Retinol dehydrogenase-14 n=1 Tax=Halanaerobium kushneri TaxID=56779 RepID=A0A1N7BAJ3_9FIRM|nr:retinol dehydrogenase-14 [Halanaerobium kushneri]